jgi:osomolarity two-component system sensor histidine kinase NIK1
MLEELQFIPFIWSFESQIPNPDPRLDEVGVAYDAIIVDSIEAAGRARLIDSLSSIPLVLLRPEVFVSLKTALDLGITSYMTSPCLPIDLANSLIPALEGRSAQAVSGHSKSFDILLAEDNAVNQRLAVKILEKYQHRVTVVNNGVEALDAIKCKSYDVILMDVQMPIMVSRLSHGC